MEGVLAHPDLELVGAWVHSDAKDGQDLGELIGAAPVGVRASAAIDAVLELQPDCVVYSPFMADPAVVDRILSAGANVVTPLGWFYPPSAERVRIGAVAKAAGVSIHGTGIHPGGITERFPLMVSALSGSITHVRAEEFSDIRTYGAPDVIRDWMLFGATPEVAMTSIMAAALGEGFGQSIQMVVDQLGFDADEGLSVEHEVAVGTEPIESPIGVIEPGLVAAQRFRWTATVRGAPVVTAAVNWLMGDVALDPPWTFGPEGERFEVEVTGDPSSLTTFKKLHPVSVEAGLRRNPGIVATALHCVNAIPAVVAAEPGLVTYLDLPMVSGRADAALRHR